MMATCTVLARRQSNELYIKKQMSTVLEAKKSVPLQKETTVGNYFVSNYPPFSFWKPEFVSDLDAAMNRPPSKVASGENRGLEIEGRNQNKEPGSRAESSLNPLGIYVHIPFCRKR